LNRFENLFEAGNTAGCQRSDGLCGA